MDAHCEIASIFLCLAIFITKALEQNKILPVAFDQENILC